jgi:glycosyltransferase involved in cell wall biosynthesis
MRVVVCTIVHHPADARIYHRQVRALLDAGHQVTYIAPVDSENFSSERSRPQLQVTPVPRAVGRHRLGALLAARRALARHAAGADLILIHDPELLLALARRRRRPPTVWDVHEDTAAALSTKPWLPRALRPPAALAVHAAERAAERRVHLILAEQGYAARFRRPHPVVPNTTYVPETAPPPAPPGQDQRVVYLGHLSPDRGVGEMIELGRLLRPRGIRVELIGPADARARALIDPAQAGGLVRWAGFVPNDRALPMVDGALAGLSLLRDEPNFRHSLPTKVVEYMARGVPVVTTPLSAAAELATRYECGFVVPFGDPRAAADAVVELAGDASLRAKMGRRGHEAALRSLGWPADARAFVAQLEDWARTQCLSRSSRYPDSRFGIRHTLAPAARTGPKGPALLARGDDPQDPPSVLVRFWITLTEPLAGGVLLLRVPRRPEESGREGIGVVAGISRAPLVRLRELVARHQLFALALAAGAVLRLIAMLGYPGALWFSGDSYVYLGSALRLRPDLSKTTGYSLFLRALEPFGSLTLVTGVQHLMGLGVAVMIYALAVHCRVPKLWATVATLPVLLDGFVVEDEHMVMAEALFTFLIMLALLLLLWRDRVSWPVALLAGLLSGYAIIVRSEGLPILILFPGFLLLRTLSKGWRSAGRGGRPPQTPPRWRGWLATVMLTIGCLVPVAAYVGWFHSWTGTYSLTRSDGFYLWGRVSSFAECSVIKPPADELKVCPSGSPSSRTPPGDYIWHAPQVHLNLPGGPVSATNDALLRDFALRAIEAQPAGYLESVLKGVALSVEWPRQKYPDPGTVSYYYFHRKPQTIPANHVWITGGTAYQDAVRYGHATPSRVVEPFAILIAGYERLFYTYGPLFGLILLTGLGGVIRFRRSAGRLPVRLVWSRRTGSMLPWVTGVVLLVFPIAVADFDYRYLLPVLPLACLAAGLAFAPARAPAPPEPTSPQRDDLTSPVPGPVS